MKSIHPVVDYYTCVSRACIQYFGSENEDDVDRARAYAVFFLRAKTGRTLPMTWGEICERMSFPDAKTAQMAWERVERDREAIHILPFLSSMIHSGTQGPLPKK